MSMKEEFHNGNIKKFFAEEMFKTIKTDWTWKGWLWTLSLPLLMGGVQLWICFRVLREAFVLALTFVLLPVTILAMWTLRIITGLHLLVKEKEG